MRRHNKKRSFLQTHEHWINSGWQNLTKLKRSLFLVKLFPSIFALFWSVYFLKSLSVAITTNHVNLNFPHNDLSLFNWWYLSIPQIVLIIFGLDIRLCLQLNAHIPPKFNWHEMYLEYYITRLKIFSDFLSSAKRESGIY